MTMSSCQRKIQGDRIPSILQKQKSHLSGVCLGRWCWGRLTGFCQRSFSQHGTEIPGQCGCSRKQRRSNSHNPEGYNIKRNLQYTQGHPSKQSLCRLDTSTQRRSLRHVPIKDQMGSQVYQFELSQENRIPLGISEIMELTKRMG